MTTTTTTTVASKAAAIFPLQGSHGSRMVLESTTTNKSNYNNRSSMCLKLLLKKLKQSLESLFNTRLFFLKNWEISGDF